MEGGKGAACDAGLLAVGRGFVVSLGFRGEGLNEGFGVFDRFGLGIVLVHMGVRVYGVLSSEAGGGLCLRR